MNSALADISVVGAPLLRPPWSWRVMWCPTCLLSVTWDYHVEGVHGTADAAEFDELLNAEFHTHLTAEHSQELGSLLVEFWEKGVRGGERFGLPPLADIPGTTGADND